MEKLEEDDDRGRVEQLGYSSIYVVVETIAEGCVTKISMTSPYSGSARSHSVSCLIKVAMLTS